MLKMNAPWWIQPLKNTNYSLFYSQPWRSQSGAVNLMPDSTFLSLAFAGWDKRTDWSGGGGKRQSPLGQGLYNIKK